MNTAFLDLVRKRSSVRAYSPKKIDREVIEYIIESARLAPSACNKQPWRFVIVDDPETIQVMCDKGFQKPVSNPWACTAPVIIVIGVVTSPVVHTAGKILKAIDYRQVDAGIAGEHICLAAREQGLGTCWIGWFKSKPIKKICGIPRTVKIVGLITLGYPAEEAQPDEFPEKTRMRADEICFFNTYGKSEK